MPAVQYGDRFDEIAHKWHDLAMRRLRYFAELYHSGRWKHYYTQEQFSVRMLDVIKAAKAWGDLAGRPQPEQPAARDDRMRPAA
jgi:hypothetical protein